MKVIVLLAGVGRRINETEKYIHDKVCDTHKFVLDNQT